MKIIRLMAFRGTGPDPAYADEPDLIRVGHVGVQLEGDPVIYGFHPTPEAVAAIGGSRAAQRWLAQHNSLEGRVFDDTSIFQRAAWLADQGAPTLVFQIEYRLHDHEFDIISAKLQAWWREKRTAPYHWPLPKRQPMPEHLNNCATFPRQLGIPVPEATGRLKYYIDAMMETHHATIWQPET